MLDKVLNDIINEYNILTESSWSRIIQHIKSDNSFAIISAFRGYGTPNGWEKDIPGLIELENKNKIELEEEINKLDNEAHETLKNDLRKSEGKYGYIEQGSGYEGVEEKSFFIPQITYEKAFYIAEKYKQQSMLWKDKDFFGIIYTLDFIDTNGVQRKKHGKGMQFNNLILKDKAIITFDPSVLKYAYSQLFKSNKSQRKKYAFIPEEYKIFENQIPSREAVMVYKKFDFYKELFKKD